MVSYLCGGSGGPHCSVIVVRTRVYHDVISRRERQREGIWYLLGYIPVWILYRFCYRIGHKPERRVPWFSFQLNIYREFAQTPLYDQRS